MTCRDITALVFREPSAFGVYARLREEAGINLPLYDSGFLSKPFQEIAA
jgi:hypothetical protein